MMAWSVTPGQAYLSKDGIRQIKSKLTNQIFRQEMLHTYELKSQSRDKLSQEARGAIRRLSHEMTQSICSVPEIDQKMEQRAGQLETVKGKKSYGYLPKPVKKTVDEIVDQLEALPVVRECYNQWCVLQNEVESYCHDKPREKKSCPRRRSFGRSRTPSSRRRSVSVWGGVTFEDADVNENDEPEQGQDEPYACWELRQIVRNESLPPEDRDNAVAELKQLADGGNPHAQHLIGKLYRDGSPLTPDWVNARYYFLRAAQQGSAPAQYALGKLFLSDDAEVHDPDEGIRWLKQAAQNGSHHAAYRLGKEYLRGEAVQKNTESRRVVHSVSRSGKPVRPIYAGQAVSYGPGAPIRKRESNPLAEQVGCAG